MAATCERLLQPHKRGPRTESASRRAQRAANVRGARSWALRSVFCDGIIHVEGVAKRHTRRSSDSHHHCCSLFNLAIFGGVLLAWETLEPTEARIVRRGTWASPSRLGHCIIGNWRVILATILPILAAVIYVAPLVALFIGIMIYGF